VFVADEHKVALWFLAGMIVFPVLAFVFSFGGFTWIAGPLSFSSAGARSVLERLTAGGSFEWWWMAIGLAVVFALCWLVVGRLGAPEELWYTALASSVLKVAAVAGTVLIYSFNVRFTLQQALARAAGSSSPYVYALGLLLYPAVGLLGCWIGWRRSRVRAEPAGRV
jgi:hypothetical protein